MNNENKEVDNRDDFINKLKSNVVDLKASLESYNKLVNKENK